MILEQDLLLLLKMLKKKLYFHPKFARLPSTYDVIARDSN